MTVADDQPITGFWPVTPTEYHDSAAVHHSGLETLRRDPWLFYCQEIERSSVRRETDALRFGAAFDAMVCGTQLVACMPKFGRKKGDLDARDEWLDEHSNALIVSKAEYDRLNRMVDSVQSHPLAVGMLEASRFQMAYRWTDYQTRFECRALADLLPPAPYDWVADLKTAADPTSAKWARDAFAHGYHRQAAWYLDGLAAIGQPRADFIHVVVGSNEDSEFQTYVRRMSDEFIEIGREENAAAMRDLAGRIRANDWRPLGYDEIEIVHPPAYARKRKDRI